MLSKAREARMSKYKKITDPNERKDVAWLTMMAAEAHLIASDSCLSTAGSSADTHSFFLRIVSFELLLVSVEQSLRLLLLLRFSIFPKNSGHNLFDLYQKLAEKDADNEWIIEGIIAVMNARKNIISPTSEEELAACLKEHCSSYSNTKYFQVNREGKLSGNFGHSVREREILHCFALVLIDLNKSWLIMLDSTDEQLRMKGFTGEKLEVLKKRLHSSDA